MDILDILNDSLVYPIYNIKALVIFAITVLLVYYIRIYN